jgi:predicted RNase H-like nuclease (RuvC/YqgF family)
MKSDKNIFQTLSRKVTINLAQHYEIRQQHDLLSSHNKSLQSRIDKLLLEVKALSEENSDLKEIVYALNQENEHYRKSGLGK